MISLLTLIVLITLLGIIWQHNNKIGNSLFFTWYYFQFYFTLFWIQNIWGFYIVLDPDQLYFFNSLFPKVFIILCVFEGFNWFLCCSQFRTFLIQNNFGINSISFVNIIHFNPLSLLTMKNVVHGMFSWARVQKYWWCTNIGGKRDFSTCSYVETYHNFCALS